MQLHDSIFPIKTDNANNWQGYFSAASELQTDCLPLHSYLAGTI
jgi:hypothetical protein